MATLISCPSCHSRLSVPSNSSATRVRCPKCKTIVSVDDALPAAEVLEQAPAVQHAPPQSAVRPVRPTAPAPRDYDSADDYEDDRAPVRRRRKKRRRRRESSGKPAWIWLIFAFGALMTVGGAIATIAWLIHAELMMDVVALGIVLAILTPISAVIFIIGMFIASSIAGGIDFGQPGWAILKVAGLLLVINIVQLIPFAGPWIALVIWICGLMLLFELDFFEACLLIVVNWALNYIARWIVIAFLLHMIMSGKGEDAGRVAEFLDPGARKPGMKKSEMDQMEAEDRAYDMILEVGGDVLRDEDREITAVVLTNSRVKDEDLALLKAFKFLGTVELTNTQITDKGLAHLKEIKTLKIVGVQGTRVTKAGIQAFKRDRPNVTVFE